jgi:hypothetical protein
MAGGLDTGSKPWALGQRRPNASLVVPMVEFLENGSGEDYTLLDMSAIEVTNAEVNAEKAAEQTKGGQVMYRLRDLDVPEVVIPLLGKYTAGNHHAQALAALELAEEEVQKSLCTGTAATATRSRPRASPMPPPVETSPYVCT